MKVWGWWKKAPEPVEAPAAPLLEDRLDPEGEEGPKRPGVVETVSKLTVDDFRRVPQIPCMRQAFLTGGAIGLVTGSIIFVGRKKSPTAVHWGVGSFLLGSAVSWEQCRYRIARGKREMAMARRMRSAPSKGNS